MTSVWFGVIFIVHLNHFIAISSHSNVSIQFGLFSLIFIYTDRRRWSHIFDVKKNKDISAENLKKLVKARGDDCVTGYVRFRKIKPCKGYQAAENKAALQLSKITAGRPMENGGYAAVVRFRLLPFLIPLAVLLSALGVLRAISTKAVVREEETTAYVIIPEEEPRTAGLTENEYAGLYISVPGYTDCRLSARERSLALYNPPGNECILQYQVYVQESLVAATGMLAAGETESVDFYDRLTAGQYKLELVANAYSLDGKTRFNTVSQQITLSAE